MKEELIKSYLDVVENYEEDLEKEADDFEEMYENMYPNKKLDLRKENTEKVKTIKSRYLNNKELENLICGDEEE